MASSTATSVSNAFIQLRKEHNESDIDLMDHCALCLYPFSEPGNCGESTVVKGIAGARHASNPKMSCFQHLWPYLGIKNLNENGGNNKPFRFAKSDTLSDGSVIKVSSLVPPMCTQCYASVEMLDDLHVEMMKIKSRIAAQVQKLHSVIADGGGVDGTGENYTGRLKNFYDQSVSSGMIASMLKAMEFLCKLRGSPHLVGMNDPLEGEGVDAGSGNWETSPSTFFENEGSESEDGMEQDVKPDVDDLNLNRSPKSEQNLERKRESLTGCETNTRVKVTSKPEVKERRSKRKITAAKKFLVSEGEESNDEYSPSQHSVESSSEESSTESDSDSDFPEPKRKVSKKSRSLSTNPRTPVKGSSNGGTTIAIQHYTDPLSTNKKSWPRSQLCEVCNKRIRVGEMMTHLQSHIKGYIYPCPNPACGLTYITPMRRDRIHLKSSPECLAQADLTLDDVSLLKCSLCEFEVHNPFSFKVHVQSHEDEHEDKSFPCPFSSCPLKFGVKQSVELHLSVHVHKKNPMFKKKLKCSICPKYIDVPELEMHYREKHKITELFQCRQCPYVFVKFDDIMHHKNVVHLKRGDGVSCDLCPAEKEQELQHYETVTALLDHYSSVHGVGDQFRCPKCKKLYSTKYRLTYHMRDGKCKGYPVVKVKKEKVVKAQVDQKVRKNLNKSTDPEKIEDDAKSEKENPASLGKDGAEANSSPSPPRWKFGTEKSQVCEICNRRKRRSEMLEHVKTHVGEYVYSCPNSSCGLVYTSPFRRNRHLKQFPECLKASGLTLNDVMTLTCNCCGFKTDNTYGYQKHINVHEQGEDDKKFPCPIENCPRAFGLKQSIELHLVNHTYYKGKHFGSVDTDSTRIFTPEVNARLLLTSTEKEAEAGTSSKLSGERWKFGLEKSQMCEVCNKRQRRSDMVSHLKTHLNVQDYIYVCPNPACALCYISPERRSKHLKNSQECLDACKMTSEQVMTMQCEVCKFVSNHPLTFKNHVQKHEEEAEEKLFPCPISHCGKVFGVKHSVEYHLPVHVYRHIPGMKMKQNCLLCSKFVKLNIFEKHLKKMHSVTTIYKCVQCPFMFDNVKRLLLHKKLHWRRGEGAKCDLCDGDEAQVFGKYAEYLEHCKNTHGAEKDVVCIKCKRKFGSVKGLKTHLETECIGEAEDNASVESNKRRIKQKSFTCDQCQPPVDFTSEERYLTHNVRLHGAEPYVCRICNKAYNSRATRNRHITEDHDPNSKKNKMGYCCEYCGMRYRLPSKLSIHRRIVHLGQYQLCPHCGKKYARSDKLKRHIQVAHMGIKPYECPTCGLRLTSSNGLKMHKLVHTGEKPFLCVACGKSFTQRGSLSTHMKIHFKNNAFQEKGENNDVNDVHQNY